MTITQNTDYVLSHPFTRLAVAKATMGDVKDLKFVLDMLQIDTYQEVARMCAKAFRDMQGENNPVIQDAIREVPPPTRLNARLPIPECVVVVMKEA